MKKVDYPGIGFILTSLGSVCTNYCCKSLNLECSFWAHILHASSLADSISGGSGIMRRSLARRGGLSRTHLCEFYLVPDFYHTLCFLF